MSRTKKFMQKGVFFKKDLTKRDLCVIIDVYTYNVNRIPPMMREI